MPEPSPWLFPSTDDPSNHIGRIRAHVSYLPLANNSGSTSGGTSHDYLKVKKSLPSVKREATVKILFRPQLMRL